MLLQFRILILSFAMSIAPVAFAEPILLEQSSSVSLSSLVQNIYEHHPAQQIQLAQQQQIDANTALSNATFADVSSVSLNHYNDVIGSSDGYQEWEGSVDMPLWLSGQQQQQAILSDTMSDELSSSQQQLRLEISAQIRESVWNVILANTASKQAHQTWQMAQKLERDVDAHVKAGELAGTELLLANSHAVKAHSHYVLAQGKLKYAINTFQTLTGGSVLPEQYEETLPSITIINDQHPSLAVADKEINTLRTKQDIAHYQDAVNPNLSIGVRRERGDDSESFNHSLGLGISFALDNEVYRRPAMAEAARVLADAEVARQQLKHALNVQLSEQLYQLEIQQQQLILALEHSNTTGQYLSSQQRAFELGEIDLVSLLHSQTLANESLNQKQSLEISVKHTIAQVNQALGHTL